MPKISNIYSLIYIFEVKKMERFINNTVLLGIIRNNINKIGGTKKWKT